MTGTAEMAATLRQIAAKYPNVVARALYREAQIEMTESKRRVPVDTGRLRASGFVDEPVIRGTNISVMLAYGTDYAVAVHENLSAYHKIGQAKYLESVLKESSPHMKARVAARINLEDVARGLR